MMSLVIELGTRYHHEPLANGFTANVIVLLFYGLDESRTRTEKRNWSNCSSFAFNNNTEHSTNALVPKSVQNYAFTLPSRTFGKWFHSKCYSVIVLWSRRV